MKARNRLKALIKNKKQNYISNILRENIVKPKKLLETLSQLGLPSKHKSTSKYVNKKTMLHSNNNNN